MEEDDIELFADGISSKDAKISIWLKCLYVILPLWGILWFFLYWNGSTGILERGYWRSKIEKRKTVGGSPRIEQAFALLRALQQAAEPPETEIFVLCLFLSHARYLVLRQEFQKEGVSYYLYEVLHKEEFLTVKVVNLSQCQIETLQKSLAEQLKNLG